MTIVKASTVPIVGDVTELADSWQRDLRAANLSSRTIQSYGEALRLFADFLADRGMPSAVSAITRENVAAFIEDQLTRHKPATAAVRFASLRVFFRWAESEGEVRESPMARMRKPQQPVVITDIPTEDELKRLLGSLGGDGFDALRDLAIVRVFMSTGARLSEVADLRYDPPPSKLVGPLTPTNHLDLDSRIVRFMGKGSRERLSSLDPKAVKALDRYLRLGRRRHTDADSTWLWLGTRGRFTGSGISQMIRERADGLGFKMHPHSLRHYRADRNLSRGMQESDVMALMGWRNPEMLRRYAAANRQNRALEAARRLADDDL